MNMHSNLFNLPNPPFKGEEIAFCETVLALARIVNVEQRKGPLLCFVLWFAVGDTRGGYSMAAGALQQLRP